MSSTTGHTAKVLRTSYQKSVAAYWDSEQAPVNLRLGEVDGLYHHHHGIGDYDPSVLEGPENTRDRRVIEELHRLETAQAEVLLDHLGGITAQDRLLDAGSGRGGTSFMAHQRFGCTVDGVTISEHQVGFANSQAEDRCVADRVRFHFRNMLDTGLRTGSRRAIWTNETTMYVDLTQLFGEFARLLQRHADQQSTEELAQQRSGQLDVGVGGLFVSQCPVFRVHLRDGAVEGVELVGRQMPCGRAESVQHLVRRGQRWREVGGEQQQDGVEVRGAAVRAGGQALHLTGPQMQQCAAGARVGDEIDHRGALAAAYEHDLVEVEAARSAGDRAFQAQLQRVEGQHFDAGVQPVGVVVGDVNDIALSTFDHIGS